MGLYNRVIGTTSGTARSPLQQHPDTERDREKEKKKPSISS